MSSNNSNLKTSNKNNVGSNLFGIVLIAICVLVILYFVYSIIKGYRDYSVYSPYYIRDIVGGTNSMKIESYRIPQPMDNQYGTEYSFSFWVFLKDTNFDSTCDDTSAGAFKHVFHRGSMDHSNQHLPLLQNPGVWLYPNTNKFHIKSIKLL